MPANIENGGAEADCRTMDSAMVLATEGAENTEVASLFNASEQQRLPMFQLVECSAVRKPAHLLSPESQIFDWSILLAT
ncbi:hypothetical protein EC9_17480 [Rosistilla ulvae]|uniref:Uncharacterized protein n=1 Tax=Rosistilla ulvae TaxID=1930277 RepID=A0A517LY82_9BACT|nr:hypothetical protein EC9_17480 [Rosistilla ulvae]